MDPNETLRLWCEAAQRLCELQAASNKMVMGRPDWWENYRAMTAKRTEIYQHEESLLHWLRKGGFEPDWTRHGLTGLEIRDSSDVQHVLKCPNSERNS